MTIQQMMMQLINSNNPLFMRAQQMVAGKSEEEIKQIAMNLCNQRGIDFNSALQQFQSQINNNNNNIKQ